MKPFARTDDVVIAAGTALAGVLAITSDVHTGRFDAKFALGLLLLLLATRMACAK